MSQGGFTGAEDSRGKMAEDGEGTEQTPGIGGFGNATTHVSPDRNQKVWRQACGSRQDALECCLKRNYIFCLHTFHVIGMGFCSELKSLLLFIYMVQIYMFYSYMFNVHFWF